MNAPLLLSSQVNRQIIQNAELGSLRQFRLSEDLREGDTGPLVGRAGEIITLAVMPSDTGDQLRTIDNYISGYKNFGFFADVVSPVVIVDQEAGNRIDRSTASAFTLLDTSVGRQGGINEVSDANTRVAYKTQERALACFIPWASENDALQQYNIRTASSVMLADLLLLRREFDVFTFLSTLTNWNTNNRTSLTTNFKWDNGSTKDPRADLHARMKASAQKVTGIAMNPDVAYYFLSDVNVRLYLKAVMGNDAPVPDLAYQLGADNKGQETINIVGYPPIYIVGAQYLLAGVLTYVLADDVILFSLPPTNVPTSMFSVATSLTFRHRGKSGTGWVTNEYLPNGRGLNGGRMLETGFGETFFFGSNIAGGLIKDVLSF
jgi:hypothetical protein